MSKKKKITDISFVSAKEDAKRVQEERAKLGAFTLAFTDPDFLLQEACRPVRLQLELLRPELELKNHNIEDGIVFFGSARIPSPEEANNLLTTAQQNLDADPDNTDKQHAVNRAQNMLNNSAYLEEAWKLAILASTCDQCNFHVITGGGPSFMSAANRGAHESGKPSVALNMMLPNEQTPNPYVTPELTFQFHYFAIRKMHFLMRAKAVAAFPGGFGTLDELFELLTLIQTEKMDPIPILLFNERFWKSVLKFDALVLEGTISPEDVNLFQYVETAEDAWNHIIRFYGLEKDKGPNDP